MVLKSLKWARILGLSGLVLLTACNGNGNGDGIGGDAPATSVDTEVSGDADPGGDTGQENNGGTENDSGDGGAELPLPDYAGAFRFLRQATFGPVPVDIDRVMNVGIEAWLDEQLAMPSAYDSAADGYPTQLDRMIDIAQTLEPDADWFPENEHNTSGTPHFDGRASSFADTFQLSVWFENALVAPDQLRQRVAYALSQILVTSGLDFTLDQRAEALAHYYDILARNALGNFRVLIDEVARSPAMGIYLSHQGNHKADPEKNTLPDENFARELMQLFTVGLYRLNQDGTPILNGAGDLIPTYSQGDIEEMSRVMTGWDLQFNSRYGRTNGSFVHFMEFNEEQHDFGEKRVLGRVIEAELPAGQDLQAALDILFEHSNTPPFISKQLIQRLVTSNPSPEYVGRVAAVFADNGEGERGDLGAVVRAILLDPEARDVERARSDDVFGKANEHVLAYTAFLRAFDVQPMPGWLFREGGEPVNDVFYFFRPQDVLGHAPLRSPSVFNFYSPDFVPQDAFYRGSTPQLVLPEMELRSPNNIASMLDALTLRRYLFERNDLIEGYGSLVDYVSARNDATNWRGSRTLALVDFSDALEAFELAMDGDSNGDYVQINSEETGEDGLTPKERGIEALLDFLERRLLGEQPLPDLFRQEVTHALDNGAYFNTGGEHTMREAVRVVAGAVQYVALSSTSMALR